MVKHLRIGTAEVPDAGAALKKIISFYKACMEKRGAPQLLVAGNAVLVRCWGKAEKLPGMWIEGWPKEYIEFFESLRGIKSAKAKLTELINFAKKKGIPVEAATIRVTVYRGEEI